MITNKISLPTGIIMILFSCFSFFACKQSTTNKQVVHKQRKAPAVSGYHFENAKQWLDINKQDSIKHEIVLAVNRTDAASFIKMDSVLVPDDFTGDREFYLPFPFTVPSISQVEKIIFFSYPAQTFAAYEYGELVYTGPVSMGSKQHPTPTGLYFTNWKAERTISTFNDEWELLWNFNIENKMGIGFHQYVLPGYPASHSCLRLLEKDARYLYNWADQWVLNDKELLKFKGTAVIVFGTYDFDAAKPWLQLAVDPKALTITAAQIEQISSTYLIDILKEQTKRDSTTVK